MKSRPGLLTSFWFIAALAVLILNDHYLKYKFPGFVSGKLSDIAGLFIFPLFWTALAPGLKRHFFWLTLIGFLFWKCPLADPFIGFINSLEVFTLARTRDISDLLALAILPFSYRYNPGKGLLRDKPIIRFSLGFMALLAFCSTSMMHTFDYNKTYSFDFSKHELVARINEINLRCDNHFFATDYWNADTILPNYNDTAFISYSSYKIRLDTLYKFDNLRKQQTSEIDTVYRYFIPVIDTLYILNNKYFSLYFPASAYTMTDTALYCDCVEARLRITGDSLSSSIFLGQIDFNACQTANGRKNMEKRKVEFLKAFESEIINKIYR